MRFFLTRRVRAVTFVADDLGRTKRTVGLNGQSGDEAVAVVRREQHAAGRIDREMARRVRGGRGGGRQRGQVAAGGVDGKATGLGGGAVDGV